MIVQTVLAALAALLLFMIFYVALDIAETLNEILNEITSIRIANEIDVYEEDDDAPGMIERLKAWREAQDVQRRVDEIVARAHLVDEETDGGKSWGRVE